VAVQVSYPGVYIEEFAPGAPIQGVGTSTAAFIGVAARGVLNEPTKVTTFERFTELFGTEPVPGTYLWYAVRGFFRNGGQVCYVVRASNGRAATWTINDSTAAPGRPIITLRARNPGATAMTIAVAASHLLPANTPVYRPSAVLAAATAAGDRALTVAADGTVPAAQVAARFRPGDVLALAGGPDRPTVVSVAGDTIRLGSPLSQAYAANTAIHLAPLQPGARSLRLHPPALLAPGILVPGTILTVTQGGAGQTGIVQSVQSEPLAEGGQTYRVTLRSGFANPIDLDPGNANTPVAQSEEHTVTVTVGGAATTYANLSMDPAHPNYLIDRINNDPGGPLTASLIEPPPPGSLPSSLPRVGNAVADVTGADEDLADLTVQNFIDALDTLRAIDDVNTVAVPDRPTRGGESMLAVQQAVIAHCEIQADRFAVLDSDPGVPLFGAGSIETQRAGLSSTRGYAALYYPWLRTQSASGGPLVSVPPSGHICGVYARSDQNRGVHKAPANEILNDALGVERRMSLIDQGQLNLQGINVVQVFQEAGRPIVWGARTTATDTNWNYVNIRRLFLFLEESIQEGIRWAVFEPNNLELWQKLKRTIGDFLERAWRDGALFGAKPEEAFYVRIDEVLNPFSEQQLGRLNIEIGVRPTYPAEFIIVRIGIWDGGSEVSEG